MLANAIENWLKNPEFNSGLELLKKYSNNQAIFFFFDNKMYGLERLIVEIKKIEISTTKAANNEKLPPVIEAIIQSKNTAWKEARDLHARLMGEPSKAIRHKMAIRITTLMQVVKDCWYKLDKYEATGDYFFLSEVKEDINKPDLYKLFAYKHLKQNYIIKAKKELNLLTDPLKKQNKASHLASLEADLTAINNRIAFLNQHIIDNNL